MLIACYYNNRNEIMKILSDINIVDLLLCCAKKKKRLEFDNLHNHCIEKYC